MATWNLKILKYMVAAGDCINLNINNSDVLMHLTMSVLNIDKSQDWRLAFENKKMTKCRGSDIRDHILMPNLALIWKWR